MVLRPLRFLADNRHIREKFVCCLCDAVKLYCYVGYKRGLLYVLHRIVTLV